MPTAGAGPWNIVAGYEFGSAWFTERSANKIGYVWSDGRITEYEIPGCGAEPMGIDLVLEKSWFAQRTGNAITSIQADAVMVPGAGTIGAWDTLLRFANPGSEPVTVMTSRIPLPQRVCAGSCFPEGRTLLPPFGGGRITASATGFTGVGTGFTGLGTFYVRALESGPLPSVQARIVNAGRPSQAAELPTIRLSTLTALNPSLLLFPGAKKAANARSSLALGSVTTGFGVRFGPPGGVSVRVEVFSSAGELLGRSSFDIGSQATLLLGDVLGQLDVSSLEDGQIRVTKIGGGDLLWGYLATVDSDGDLSITPGQVP